MKLRMALIVLAAFVSAYSESSLGQEPGDARRNLDELRTELSNTQNKVADLQIWLEQLDFDLKPENIERYFAATGSTRPEELRESRRRQLQSQKDRAVIQLQEMTSSVSRLEAEVSNAQALAYQQSVGTVLKRDRQTAGQFLALSGVRTAMAALCAILGAIGFYFITRRWRNV